MKKLLLDNGLLRRVCKRFGYKVPEAKDYFEKQFLTDATSDRERELRTYTLRSIWGAIESRPVRAQTGYPHPAWTPKEVVEKGLIVLVDAGEMINQEQTLALLLSDIYSQILAYINKRRPHDPNDKPILIIIDEVYPLLKIPGMAYELGKISPLYRSRKVQIVIIIQAAWQLADDLKEQIWSLGNIISFKLDGFDDAYETAQQLFKYNPHSVRRPSAYPTGQPIMESDRGEYLIAANWIQHLNHRECLLKLHATEANEEPFVRHVQRTTDRPNQPLDEPLGEYKDRLLRKRGLSVKGALEVINKRNISNQQPERPTV